MKRGEIWWAKLESPAKTHPVVLLSRNDAYLVRSLIMVAPLTSRIRHIPTEVPFTAQDGLPQNCVANLDIILTIPKKCLLEKLTTLNQKKLDEVEKALCFALAIGVSARTQ